MSIRQLPRSVFHMDSSNDRRDAMSHRTGTRQGPDRVRTVRPGQRTITIAAHDVRRRS
jgi:hypothetical protein